MFLRNSNKIPCGCVAVNYTNGTLSYQFSVLNPADSFDRKLARLIACGRLAKDPILVSNLPQVKSSHEITRTVMEDLASLSYAPARAIKAAKLWLNKSSELNSK